MQPEQGRLRPGPQPVRRIHCFLAEGQHALAINALGQQAGLQLDAERSLLSPHTEVWAASFSDSPELVGFVVGQRLADELEVLDLATLVRVRRQGVASALMRELRASAEERRFSALLLEVRAENAAAMQLYLKLGFVVVHRRLNYYRCPPDDAVCMRLSLAQAR